MRRLWWLALFLAAALVAAQCSDSGSETSDPASDQTEETTDEPETEEPGAGSPDDATGDDDVEPLDYQETIDRSFQDVHEYWDQELPEAYDGIDWEALPSRRIYPFTSETEPVECNRFLIDYSFVEFNAAYFDICDSIAYDDEGLFPQLYEDHGNFANALVIAHELGHRVQGTVLSVREFQNGASVDLELQADCFAGAWTKYVDSGESNLLSLEPGDLDIAIAGYLRFRDQPGTDPTAEGAHGTAFDRINAFQEGYEQGPARCAEYVDERGRTFDRPPIIDIQFGSTRDVRNEGNVRLDQAIDFTTQLLDAYWPAAYGEYEPIEETVDFEIEDPDEVDADDLEDAACGDEEVDPEALDDTIFYCEEDNFVGWDQELLEEVYDASGDFGVAALIAGQYAHAVAVQQGVDGDDLAVNLYADCLNGSWAGAVYNEAVVTDDQITLSPGDLDEVVQAFLAFRDEVDTETPEQGTAFQRTQAFRTGFFEGPNECARVLAGDGS